MESDKMLRYDGKRKSPVRESARGSYLNVKN